MSSDAYDLDEERRRRLALPRVIKAKPLWMFLGLIQQGYLSRASKRATGYEPKD